MIALGAVLSLVMGIVLGLLGGGGSILSVPILVYACGLAAKPAIATSLVVVGTTSAFALLAHARSGNVLWGRGALFAAFAMLGAYGGGHLAAWFSGTVLLVLFAAVMIATAVAMLRGSEEDGSLAPRSQLAAPWKIAAEAFAVGGFTGLVGAGGGFLVVPALVLLGGMPMHAAVGTSLLIISLKSFAALASYLTHVDIDPWIASVVTAAAVAGSVIGATVAGRVRADLLRHAFAWLVLVMGLGTLYEQLSSAGVALPRTVIVPLAGGALIGLAASVMLLWSGRIAGISGIVGGLLRPKRGDVAWRAVFVGGLLLGAALLVLVHPAALEVRAPGSLASIALAGVLVGYGTRLGNGCTSGHGVCGVSRLSRRSLVATATFMATGALTVFLVRSILGGTP